MNIKATIAAALVAIIATTAQAQERTTLEICTEWGQFSEDVMWLRQNGVALSDLMKEVGEATELEMQIILEAWNMPRFNTQSIVAEVIQDFRNDQEHACFLAFSQGAFYITSALHTWPASQP